MTKSEQLFFLMNKGLTEPQRKAFRDAIQKGLDITPIAKTWLNPEQIYALTDGLENGIDISSLIDSHISAKRMLDIIKLQKSGFPAIEANELIGYCGDAINLVINCYNQGYQIDIADGIAGGAINKMKRLYRVSNLLMMQGFDLSYFIKLDYTPVDVEFLLKGICAQFCGIKRTATSLDLRDYAGLSYSVKDWATILMDNIAHPTKVIDIKECIKYDENSLPTFKGIHKFVDDLREMYKTGKFSQPILFDDTAKFHTDINAPTGYLLDIDSHAFTGYSSPEEMNEAIGCSVFKVNEDDIMSLAYMLGDTGKSRIEYLTRDFADSNSSSKGDHPEYDIEELRGYQHYSPVHQESEAMRRSFITKKHLFEAVKKRERTFDLSVAMHAGILAYILELERLWPIESAINSWTTERLYQYMSFGFDV